MIILGGSDEEVEDLQPLCKEIWEPLLQRTLNLLILRHLMERGLPWNIWQNI
jgi:hypothetical protein